MEFTTPIKLNANVVIRARIKSLKKQLKYLNRKISLHDIRFYLENLIEGSLSHLNYLEMRKHLIRLVKKTNKDINRMNAKIGN